MKPNELDDASTGKSSPDRKWILGLGLLATSVVWTASGCVHNNDARGAAHDRPFPLGAVTDAHWETQQTNAEAADFIVYTHEFRGDTTQLGPAGRRHLEEMALRLHHVPFPVVVATVENDANPELDRQRREAIAHHLAAMGVAGVGSLNPSLGPS